MQWYWRSDEILSKALSCLWVEDGGIKKGKFRRFDNRSLVWRPFYYIDTKALRENTPLMRKYTKFMRNYIRDSSGVNIFTVEDIDDFTDIMFDPGLKQYLNLLVYDRNIFESFSDVFGTIDNRRNFSGNVRKCTWDLRATFGEFSEIFAKSSKMSLLNSMLCNKQNNTWYGI